MTFLRAPIILSGLLLSLGLASAGYFIGDGISDRRSGNRSISVKGLSEKEVPASIAIWNIGFSATGNNLPEVNTRLGESTKAILEFLKEAGFEEAETSIQPPSVDDTTMEEREKDTPPPPERYRAQQSVLLRTSKVTAVKPALSAISSLMMRGVLLSGNSKPAYIYNELNEIKPAMIQEATKNARIAAEQFSRDSQTSLGKLRNASQGWFNVEDRDAATPERKNVRVVVDVEYEVK